MDYVVSTPRSKALRVLLAAVLALGLVPSLSVSKAFAAEPKFIGSVHYPVAYDENGFPLYNEDGTYQRDAPYVSLENVENVSGTLVIPEKFDVVVRDQDGKETVEKDIVPSLINFQGGDYQGGTNWTNEGITSIDLTQCSSLKHVTVDKLPFVESIDAHGLDLQSVRFDTCKALVSANLEGNENIKSYTLWCCDILPIPDFAQPQWSGLTQLTVQGSSQEGRNDFVAFDASSLPDLEELTIGSTGLTSIDVSSCARLNYLHVPSNELTELDTASLPAGIRQFDCRYNHISDTTALIERFGEDWVLPQHPSTPSAGLSGLMVVDEYTAGGTIVAGGNVSFALNNTYRPSGTEAQNFNRENWNDTFAISNYKAVSDDPTVASVSFTSDSAMPSLRVDTLKAGTTTLTIDYSFEGIYGTYAGRQVIDFTVAARSNPIVSLSCAAEASVPMETNCPVDGKAHQYSPNVVLPLDVALQDPDRPLTTDSHVVVTSSDDSVVIAQSERNPGDLDTEYAIRLLPQKLGTATVTVKSVSYANPQFPQETDPVTVQVTVSEVDAPTLNVADTVEVVTTRFGGNINIVNEENTSPLGFLSEYVKDEAYGYVAKAHYFYPESGQIWNGSEYVRAVTAESDNEEVVSVDLRYGFYANYKKPGTAHVTIRDIWGNEGTCTVVVKDVIQEVPKLSLSKNEITIKKGELIDLAAFVEGIDALDPSVAGWEELLVFKSSDGNIAPIKYRKEDPRYVSLMLGRNVGDASISANMLIGGDMAGSLEYIDQWEVMQFGTLTVHVVDGDEPTGNPATSVEVTGDSNQVVMGSTLQLSAAITPANADNAGELAWSSSDEAVATVDASGKVSPVAPGKATITATVGDVFGTFEVTVVAKAVPATAVEVSAAKTAMKAGETQQLMATVTPKDTTDALVWSSSDEKVLAVDQSGLVTAVGNGTAAIKATAGEVSDTTEDITVTTSVTGVTLDATALDLFAGGDAATLKATVAPATASNKEVTWASSDESVTTVDAEGTVSPVAAGTATITATTADGGFKATCTVTVKQHATGLKLNMNEVAITGADTVQLKATVEPDNATNKNVTWTSSDPGVATVDVNGVVTSVAKGTATITATSEDGSFTDTCTVTVSNPVTSITVEPTSLNLIKGEAASVLTVLAGELSGAVDDGEVTWESSDSSIASVDGGAVTALKSGSATITAKAGALSAACTVKVTNPVKAVSISETSKTVTVGDEPFTLTATVDPVDADDTTITWTSSNPKVATVDEQGNVTIKAAGTANIVASVGGVSASCALTVNAKVVAETPAGSGFAASVSATDSETAQTLETLKNDGGLNLVMDAIEELTESAKGAIDKLTAAGEAVAEVFDIHFAKDNGDEVVLSSKDGEVLLTVKVRLTDSMRALLDQGMELKVSYVGDDGTIEEKETWVEGDSLYFVTSHFSDYVVTGKPKPDGGEGDGGQGQTPEQGTGNPPMAKTDGGDTGSKLAPTGDPLTVAPIVIGVFACIAAGAVVLSRRKAH